MIDPAAGPEGIQPERLDFHRLADAAGHDPVADLDVTYDSGLPRDHRVVADRRASGDPHLRNDERVPTYRDIMGNVNQVVNFRPRPDDRVGGRATGVRRSSATAAATPGRPVSNGNQSYHAAPTEVERPKRRSRQDMVRNW